MSVSANATKIQYTPNGVSTTFAYNFPILLNTDIKVIFTEDGVDTVKTLTTHYSVTGVGSESGGNVVFVSPPSSSVDRITILRNMSLTQLVDYVANDAFPAETHEKAIDKLTMVVQQLYEALNRVPKIPESELTTVNMAVPIREKRLSKILGFDNNGDITLREVGTLSEVSIVHGSLNLVHDVITGSVTFPETLSIVPQSINLTVQSPTGGFVIFGTVIVSSVTVNGFDFYLSAAPEDDNYILSYVVVNDAGTKVKGGNKELTIGTNAGSVIFNTPMTSIPTVVASVSTTDGMVLAVVVSNITTTGFDFSMSGDIESTGCLLNYLAVTN